MIGRLLRKADFERTLAMPPRSRSAHFAVHYLHARPSTPKAAGREAVEGELCTGDAPQGGESVDNLVSGYWLRYVLSKRHAPRSVTRNMLRRQVRAAMQRQQSGLRPGLWLVRLRAPFGRPAFISARSPALAAAIRSELDALLAGLGPPAAA